MNHQIKHRWTGCVIYECEAESFSQCVLRAIDAKVNLRGSDLSDSDLSGSNLSGSNLSGSDLSGSNLSDSNLRGSDLSGSDLRGSNLSGSDLSGSDLRGSNLRGSNLSDSNLQPIRDDMWAVLCSAPREVLGLRKALVDGRVDGSTYVGSCACLVGTLANERHCTLNEIPGLTPNSSRPIERFFCAIDRGDTPETSQFARLAVEWIDQWRLLLSGNPFEGQEWPEPVSKLV